jgi:hypothetical protein
MQKEWHTATKPLFIDQTRAVGLRTMFKSWFTMTSATGFSGSVLIKIWASGLYRPICSDGGLVEEGLSAFDSLLEFLEF